MSDEERIWPHLGRLYDLFSTRSGGSAKPVVEVHATSGESFLATGVQHVGGWAFFECTEAGDDYPSRIVALPDSAIARVEIRHATGPRSVGFRVTGYAEPADGAG